MRKELIIFGTGKIAEVLHYYATEECGFNVTAFCVDAAFNKEKTFLEKPVCSFEAVENEYPASSYDMFIAVGYQNLNELRRQKCEDAIKKGYQLVSIISPLANLPKNVKVGFNCFIMPPAIVHPCVTLGNNVFVWSGAMVGHHSAIGDDCWLTSNCSIGGNVVTGNKCFIAMGATVSHSVTIGRECFLGANSLVTKNMDDGQVVIAESSKPIRLNSTQFLKMSGFSDL